jgi:hypothetical protein
MLSDAPRQKVSGDHDRTWMSDDYFDLIVWQTESNAIHGFQLCYGKPRWERALTWMRGRGFSHSEIDSGEELATVNRAPVLVANGIFPAAEVLREFERRGAELPESLRGFIVKKICDFVAQSNG